MGQEVEIGEKSERMIKHYHADSVMCAVFALALKTKAFVLFEEATTKARALREAGGVRRCFGSQEWVSAEKAVAANVAAIRELDMNGAISATTSKSNLRGRASTATTTSTLSSSQPTTPTQVGRKRRS